MSHKMSVKKIRGMVNSAAKEACKSMGIGQAKKTPKPVDALPKEPAFERVFRKLQKMFDEAQVKYHKDSLYHIVAATKDLAVMAKRFTKGFMIHQKKQQQMEKSQAARERKNRCR